MSNRVTQKFIKSGTIAIPAGVNFVTVQATRNNKIVVGSLLAIDGQGNAFASGTNSSGTLGVGDTLDRSSPVAVLGGINFLSVFSNTRGTAGTAVFGIDQTGKAYSWGGSNTNGQLALGDVVNRSSPVAVLGGLSFYRIYGDSQCTYFFGLTTDGTAYAWGSNALFGNLGVGDVIPRSSPVAVLGGLKFKHIVIPNTGGTALGLAVDGTAYSWGSNSNGRLGLGDVVKRSSPVAVLGSLTFVDVVEGGDSFYGLTSAGAVYGWGLNDFGQLANGDVIPRSSPVAVLGGLAFTKIWAEQKTAWGMTSTGALYSWGKNDLGQGGLGDIIPRSSPVAVLGGLLFADADCATSCFGFLADGTAYSWGYNFAGVLGVGDTTNRSSPVAVLGGLKFSKIWNGTARNTAFAIATDGKFYAWGANAAGDLGVGDQVNRSSPVAVLGPRMLGTPTSTTEYTVPVTPGSTYTVTVGRYAAFFGNNVVGQGGVDSILVSYDQ